MEDIYSTGSYLIEYNLGKNLILQNAFVNFEKNRVVKFDCLRDGHIQREAQRIVGVYTEFFVR